MALSVFSTDASWSGAGGTRSFTIPSVAVGDVVIVAEQSGGGATPTVTGGGFAGTNMVSRVSLSNLHVFGKQMLSADTNVVIGNVNGAAAFVWVIRGASGLGTSVSSGYSGAQSSISHPGIGTTTSTSRDGSSSVGGVLSNATFYCIFAEDTNDNTSIATAAGAPAPASDVSVHNSTAHLQMAVDFAANPVAHTWDATFGNPATGSDMGDGYFDYHFPTLDAVLDVSPNAGNEDLDVVADVSDSLDSVDGDHILYTLDWGDGYTAGPDYVDLVPTVDHTYFDDGDYIVTLTVTNSVNSTALDTDEVIVSVVLDDETTGVQYERRHATAHALPYHLNTGLLDGR